MSSGLGRGLSSLIPQKINRVVPPVEGKAVVDTISSDDKNKILHLSPGLIKVNPMQPRKRFNEQNLDELVESIRQYGVIQPLIVNQKDGEYELIAGERRLRASKIAGLEKVPVILRDVDSQEKLEVALIENVQRADLNPIEMAVAYRKLMDEFNLTQEDVAKKMGKSRSSVANALRLLNLPSEIQLALMEGKLSEGHAKLLIGLDSEEKQLNLFRRISLKGLSVSDTLGEARRMGGTKQARVKINYADKDKEFAFREFFGTKAEVKRKGKGGQVILDFYSDEELGEMIGKIRPVK